MEYSKFQPVPVLSADGYPLMPCHPARARKLLEKGKAKPHHYKGLFAIKLTARTRQESQVQDVSLNIDPGSDTSGFAVVSDNQGGERTVLAALELKHRAKAIKATLHDRASKRRARRYRLRHRAPRFDNRPKPKGWLPPSVRSLKDDTLRVLNTLRQLYPVSSISIEANKFDTQLMTDPDIKGKEYQRGTLFGHQLRALIFHSDHNRCAYCGRKHSRLELDHVVPRGKGSNRIDNLITSCRPCNQAKGNKPVEEFLKDKPELLKKIKERLERSNLASAAHVNSVLPSLIDDLKATGLPVTLADAATVSWNRKQMEVQKTHCYDAALQGTNFTSVKVMPSRVLQLRPNNGRSKQKANVDRKGTPIGKQFRNQQKLPKHLRKTNPAHAHASRRQRHGPLMIGTGDAVRFLHNSRAVTGRAVLRPKDKRLYLSGTNPEIGTSIKHCSLLARNPGWTIRSTAPSQQKHQLDRPQTTVPATSQPDPPETD